MQGVTCYVSPDPAQQLGVLSFTVEGWESERVAQELSELGIAVRAGYHCAPFAHKTAGTIQSGTVRLSFSAFNRKEEVETFARAMRRILR